MKVRLIHVIQKLVWCVPGAGPLRLKLQISFIKQNLYRRNQENNHYNCCRENTRRSDVMPARIAKQFICLWLTWSLRTWIVQIQNQMFQNIDCRMTNSWTTGHRSTSNTRARQRSPISSYCNEHSQQTEPSEPASCDHPPGSVFGNGDRSNLNLGIVKTSKQPRRC